MRVRACRACRCPTSVGTRVEKIFSRVVQLCGEQAAACLLGVQVDLVLNVVERKTGGLSCGGGISSQGHSEGALPGFIGSASFSQRNLFGLNQKLAATVEIGQVLHLLPALQYKRA